MILQLPGEPALTGFPGNSVSGSPKAQIFPRYSPSLKVDHFCKANADKSHYMSIKIRSVAISEMLLYCLKV